MAWACKPARSTAERRGGGRTAPFFVPGVPLASYSMRGLGWTGQVSCGTRRDQAGCRGRHGGRSNGNAHGDSVDHGMKEDARATNVRPRCLCLPRPAYLRASRRNVSADGSRRGTAPSSGEPGRAGQIRAPAPHFSPASWRLRAFCPQACYAGGSGPFRYLLYKDVNRIPTLPLPARPYLRRAGPFVAPARPLRSMRFAPWSKESRSARRLPALLET